MRRRSSNNMKSLVLVVLVVAICGLSVAYALLSTTLSISGSTKVSAASWGIKFKNLSGSNVGGATYTLPTLSDTALSDYEIILTKPGDSVTFAFDIVNEGTIAAAITSFVKNTPTCSGVAGSTTGTTDAPLVCNNITYSLTYADGTPVAINDTLAAGETKSVKLSLTYNSNAASLPSNDVAISNLDITIIYGQV